MGSELKSYRFGSVYRFVNIISESVSDYWCPIKI